MKKLSFIPGLLALVFLTLLRASAQEEKWNARLSPFVILDSGPPFDITVGRDLYGTTLFNGRPGIPLDVGPQSFVPHQSRADHQQHHLAALRSGQPACRRWRLRLLRRREQPQVGVANATYVLI